MDDLIRIPGTKQGVGFDALVGPIPGVGDLVDVAHRANRRNYRLLEAAVAADPDPEPPTVGYVLAALTLTVLPLLLSVALAILALVLLFRWLSSR
jgi:hypothetical protein